MTVVYEGLLFIIDRHLFFMVLEAGKSKIKVLVDKFLMRVLFPAFSRPSSFCVLT